MALSFVLLALFSLKVVGSDFVSLRCTCRYSTGLLTVDNNKQAYDTAFYRCRKRIMSLRTEDQPDIKFAIRYVGQTGQGDNFQSRHYECLSVHSVLSSGANQGAALDQAHQVCVSLSHTLTRGLNHTPRTVQVPECETLSPGDRL